MKKQIKIVCNVIALFFTCCISSAQEPVLSFNFETGLAQDDSETYQAELKNGAVILTTEDGNHVLNTESGTGYLDLGSSGPKAALAQFNDDYSISIDLCVGSDNSLGGFSWAWALANGTSQYIGFINAAGNTNWYYEIKNSTSSYVRSYKGFTTNTWHTVTIVQKGTNCICYFDGDSVTSSTITINPSIFEANITGCYIGKSPYSADATMKNTLFDNFKIYNIALTTEQVVALSDAKPTSTTLVVPLNIALIKNRKELYSAKGVQFIHKEIVLPATCTYGTVEWSYTPSVPNGSGSLSYKDGTFTVLSRAEKPTIVGELQGVMTYDGSQYDVFDTPLKVIVAPEDDAYGYLFCHMPNRVPEDGFQDVVAQTVTYALGLKEDKGLVYNELNRGASIIEGIGTTLPWCRDAFLAKDTLRKCYYLVTTDLYGAVNGGTSMLENYSIGMFKSYDLINWTYNRCDLKQYFKQNPVTDIYNDAGSGLFTYDKVSRVWAPQVIMINGDPYIYYAVGNRDNGNKDHFYISKANDDFTGIESFKVLYKRNSVINILDADIVFLETDSMYHMSFRDEESGCIADVATKDLLNPDWSEFLTTFEDGFGFEASSVFRRINDDVWNVGNVNYRSRVGFHFHTADAMLRDLQPENDLSGNVSPQHGSFVYLTETEFKLLQTWSDLKALIADATELNETVESNILAARIGKAQTDITTDHSAPTDLSVLLTLLSEDYLQLKNRYQFENVLYDAKYSNYAESPQEGILDALYNNKQLNRAIISAQSVYDSEDASLLTAMIDTLKMSVGTYNTILANNGTSVGVNNGFFNTSNSGWTSSSTNVGFYNGNGVGEFFSLDVGDHSISMNQKISGLDSGYYLVKTQAYERNGFNDHSGRNYKEGVEQIRSKLTANDRQVKIQSLYAVPYNDINSCYGFVNGVFSANAVFSADSKNYANYVVVYVRDGELTIGLQRKPSIIHTSNWTCFDNFEVFYLGNDLSNAVPEVKLVEDRGEQAVYNISGVLVGKTEVNGKLPKYLPSGVCIVNGKKYVVIRK